MPRIVALDVGDATVGIAATDELQLVASPVCTVRRSRSLNADLKKVVEAVRELNPEKVIVGLPLDQEGREGAQALKVKDFSNRLAQRLSVPVELWDERFSTADAEERLVDLDVSRKKRKERIHAAAAAVILESYLKELEIQKARTKK
ncbi:MAG: Holliday junction resolvase RuvX [Armatimonadota bacterium]|nr:Holliday junction resolvase RuvX [Armatimonadota bacterium]